MPSVLIDNLDEVTFRKISDLAASHNRSVQSEIAEILRDSLMPTRNAGYLRLIADDFFARTNAKLVAADSTDLLRQDRER